MLLPTSALKPRSKEKEDFSKSTEILDIAETSSNFKKKPILSSNWGIQGAEVL